MNAQPSRPTDAPPAATLRAAEAELVVRGRWLRQAMIRDEEWTPGAVVDSPEALIGQARACRPRADLLVFAQKLPATEPHFTGYHMEWDNVAAVSTASYEAWLNSVSRKLRQDLNRAKRKGLDVRLADFDDALVRGIVSIYNETPIRQKRRFIHYGKSVDETRRVNATYLDRADFIGAYVDDDLVGLIKLVYIGGTARIMQIIAKESHQDCRPTNALIATAIETAAARHCTHLIYGKYTYFNKTDSSIVQFKRRNGFTEFRLPRYVVPLTGKGAMALTLNLHQGYRHLAPEKLTYTLLDVREKLLRRIERRRGTQRVD